MWSMGKDRSDRTEEGVIMDRQNVCFGFIGTGNMGSALARAVRRRLDGSQILLANQTMEKASRLAEELDAMAVDNLATA